MTTEATKGKELASKTFYQYQLEQFIKLKDAKSRGFGYLALE